MTKEQILIVKKTWSYFREIDPVITGDVFYSKLFLDVPQVKNLFHSSREEQAKKLIDMFSIMVGRLDHLEDLTHDIRQLASRHVKYGVRKQHYEAVGTALLWTLQHGLGRDWNHETREAWAACYATISGIMIQASEYPGSSKG